MPASNAIPTLAIELSAVIVAIAGQEPQILIDRNLALPTGPFETGHRTLEQGLRDWARLPLDYVEQLYTFADRDRSASDQRTVSIGYLALMRNAAEHDDVLWSPWYAHFPWEDHRQGTPGVIADIIMPALDTWKNTVTGADAKRERIARVDIAFPTDLRRWNDELVLQRYELLWEAGLVSEAKDDKNSRGKAAAMLGKSLPHDHRRILATAIARLRAKIKYRPVVFELLPDQFTLLHLQNTVEALAGLRLHKQNFRRLVETQGLVEETGAMTRGASGRPAKLFAFRRNVLLERAVAGTKLPRTS